MKKDSGITLIELISVIVILGLAIPVLLTMWADVAWRSTRSETLADASFYAEQLMEEVRARKFDEIQSVPKTSSSSFGVDTAESSADSSTFDDVDDFVGASDTNVTIPALRYRRSVGIEYVNLASNSTWQSCGATTCTSSTDCSQCSACCYKRINVRVSTTDNSINNATLSTIISSY